MISIDTLPDNVLPAIFPVTCTHMTTNSKKKGKGCDSHWYTCADDGELEVSFLDRLVT